MTDMPVLRVTGIVWWQMGISHYKALFRRSASHERSSGYTKDFLQAPTRLSHVFREMFEGRPPDYEPASYLWPGGRFDVGKIYAAADYNHAAGSGRLEVGQWTQQGAPHPWRIGNPEVDPLITLPGDPDAAIPVQADLQWEAIAQLRPWLMMVQVEGSQSDFHIRAYLGDPIPEFRGASLDHVPEAVRVHMTRTDGLVGEMLPEVWFDTNDFREPWLLTHTATGAPAGGGPAVSAPEVAALGQTYRRADETATSTASEPFEIDPDERDRATRAHAATQNALAEAVEGRGIHPRSPTGDEPNYDLAWEEADETTVVAEVKSLTTRNAERQLRLAVGQVLRYRFVLSSRSSVRALIVTSEPPPQRDWYSFCSELGIGLVARRDLDTELDEWLDETAND
jgi:hypothetical protein